MSPKETIILGIDPGYGRCGFGVIRGSGSTWAMVTHGVITSKKEEEFPARLLEIATDFETLLERHQPHVLSLESLFFAKSTTTALKVAEVRGMLAYLAALRGLRMTEVKPNEVKLAVTGYGRADKQQVQQMVKTIFHLSAVPEPDDAADALAIAWTAAERATYG